MGLSPDNDHVARITTRGPRQGVGKFYYASNPVHGNLQPWVLDVFSAGIVTPATTQVLARAIPGECPFVDGWENDLGSHALGIGRTNMAMKSLVEVGVREALYWNSLLTSDEEVLTFEKGSDGTLSSKTVTLLDNMSLAMALCCSLLLAMIGGLFGAVFFPTLAEAFFDAYNEDVEHYDRYQVMQKLKATGRLQLAHKKGPAAREAEKADAAAAAEIERAADKERSGAAAVGWKKSVAQAVATVMTAVLPDPEATPKPSPYQALEIITSKCVLCWLAAVPRCRMSFGFSPPFSLFLKLCTYNCTAQL